MKYLLAFFGFIKDMFAEESNTSSGRIAFFVVLVYALCLYSWAFGAERVSEVQEFVKFLILTGSGFILIHKGQETFGSK